MGYFLCNVQPQKEIATGIYEIRESITNNKISDGIKKGICKKKGQRLVTSFYYENRRNQTIFTTPRSIHFFAPIFLQITTINHLMELINKKKKGSIVSIKAS